MTIRRLVDACYERFLKIQCTNIPNHVAIIQDGNRRYARLFGFDTASGHRAGADTTEKMLDWAKELGIRHLTIYSFSTENFERSDDEIKELFLLFKEKLLRVQDDERVHNEKICVRILGDRSLLPDDLVQCIEAAEEATAEYDSFFLNIALSYGGRNEIVHAARSVLYDVKNGDLATELINSDVIEKHLHKGLQLPPVDLMIRTGNEKRTSNFLPWLANGNESTVYFSAPFWPLFRKIDLLRAIRVYDQRVGMSHHLP